MEDMFKYLAAGGDIGIYILLLALHKLSTRLTIVETKINAG